MRFWVFSDLHLDANAAFAVSLPHPRPSHDAVLIAGDLCEGMAAGVDWIAAQALNERPVYYVAGNHEFYGRDRDAEVELARRAAARHHNIHVLEADRASLDGITILGTTLWTDYEVTGSRDHSMALAERMMSDHRLIAHGSGSFSPAAARAEHLQRVGWLQTAIAAASRSRSPVIVITHHAPSPQSISARFQGHPLTASFTSNLEHVLPGVSLWVHGHTHRRLDYRIGDCRIINNPLGYLRREKTGFSPELVVEV